MKRRYIIEFCSMDSRTVRRRAYKNAVTWEDMQIKFARRGCLVVAYII